MAFALNHTMKLGLVILISLISNLGFAQQELSAVAQAITIYQNVIKPAEIKAATDIINQTLMPMALGAGVLRTRDCGIERVSLEPLNVSIRAKVFASHQEPTFVTVALPFGSSEIMSVVASMNESLRGTKNERVGPSVTLSNSNQSIELVTDGKTGRVTHLNFVGFDDDAKIVSGWCILK